MGMDYYIRPNKLKNVMDDFPNGLSPFFDQFGGYDEYSEVAQVEKLLEIDLSAFQNYSGEDGDEGEDDECWQDINDFEDILTEFILKIENKPNYFQEVIHNPNNDRHNLENDKENPFYLYPPDYGYLKRGQLLTDLKSLKNTIKGYKSKKVTKILLVYM